MSLLQFYIQECLKGHISVAELKDKLHFLIDDVVIPDVLHALDNMPDFSHLFKEGE